MGADIDETRNLDIILNKMLKTAINKKGVFFTLSIILILVPLIMLTSFYSTTSKTKMEDTNSKVRCDELHYFVEDVKKDLSRAGTIFGRRAAIYAIDYAVKRPGNPLINYTFDCNPLCGVDCQKIVYPRNGSQAAIAELALCGTLNGSNVTYMVNHTIKEWISKIENRSKEKNFMTNMTIREIKVTEIDPFNFSITIDSEVAITDYSSICYYMGTNFKIRSNTSLIGLEDPLYSFATNGSIFKYIYDCDPTINLSQVIKTGSGGGLTNASGVPVVYPGNTTGTTKPGLEDFCINTSGDYLKGFILVMNGTLSCTSSPVLTACFNASSTQHFGGIVINTGATMTNCPISIPYVNGTGSFNVTPNSCLYIKNDGPTHQVINATNCQNLDYTCYLPSNNTEYCGGCSGNCTNGPSFFDRLDGRYTLSEYYVNQSIEEFNNSLIGLETFVDVYEIREVLGTDPNVNASKIDYMYWQSMSGNNVCQICSGSNPFFKVDCPHAKKYGLESGC